MVEYLPELRTDCQPKEDQVLSVSHLTNPDHFSSDCNRENGLCKKTFDGQ